MQILGEGDRYDFVITEIGGTVGDIESLPYIEAVRQMRWEHPEDTLVIHLTLVPFLKAAGELKTKPTQHSVKQLLEFGVQPDVLVCRTEHNLSKSIRNKLARFCNVGVEAVIQSIDADTIYDVPLFMQQERLDEVVLDKLGVEHKGNLDLNRWLNFLERHKNPKGSLQIALVGKYVELQDSYKSIVEAFTHAGAACGVKVKLKWVHSEQVQRDNAASLFSDVQGVLVAPGFGSRGIDGKIEAIRHARENAIPFFGICLGMQCAVIEFARNVLGLEEAHSTEIKDYTPDPVIDLMEEQKGLADMGGTMRLGAYPCEIAEGSLAASAYGKQKTKERHRHRYEFNDAYRQRFIDAGMIPTGTHPDSGLVEIVEIPGHPWFLGAQFHPEYKSTVVDPHPLFSAFVKAAMAFAGGLTDEKTHTGTGEQKARG